LNSKRLRLRVKDSLQFNERSELHGEEGLRVEAGSRSGAKIEFIAIRVETSKPMRLPVCRATATAIRFHSSIILRELAVCSRQRASV
jgi:hypothetical protein